MRQQCLLVLFRHSFVGRAMRQACVFHLRQQAVSRMLPPSSLAALLSLEPFLLPDPLSLCVLKRPIISVAFLFREPRGSRGHNELSRTLFGHSFNIHEVVNACSARSSMVTIPRLARHKQDADPCRPSSADLRRALRPSSSSEAIASVNNASFARARSSSEISSSKPSIASFLQAERKQLLRAW